VAEKKKNGNEKKVSGRRKAMSKEIECREDKKKRRGGKEGRTHSRGLDWLAQFPASLLFCLDLLVQSRRGCLFLLVDTRWGSKRKTIKHWAHSRRRMLVLLNIKMVRLLVLLIENNSTLTTITVVLFVVATKKTEQPQLNTNHRNVIPIFFFRIPCSVSSFTHRKRNWPHISNAKESRYGRSTQVAAREGEDKTHVHTKNMSR
jgi:hypothetical protein